jgi:histidinol dehydrogenase
MRAFDTREHDLATLADAFGARLEPASRAAEETVRAILDDVRRRGDAAVIEYTRRWDWPDAERVVVEDDQIEAAAARVRQTRLWPALESAAGRIRDFHEKQKRQSWFDATSRPGELLGQLIRPIARVGVYVPGGGAAYPSTVLMAAIPARVAGVPAIAVATPPGRESGRVPDATLAAARIAGVQAVYAMGGAQAIGALAYGTQAVRPVDKIVGPGNLYVNLAKRLVYGTVGIDMLAGPSEVLVLADDAADPGAAAADILAQTEHDPLCSAVVVSPSDTFLAAVVGEIESQVRTLPRAQIVGQALAANGFLVRTRSLEEAAQVASIYAPEHLHLDVREPWALLARIENAGAILIGGHSSAPLGDYVAGPSHTLPTAGCARFSSPLSVDDFAKKTSLVYLSEAAGRQLSPLASTLAEFEGLEAHARAAMRRS